MALNSKNLPKPKSKDFVEQPNIDPGVYPARIVQIIDYGLQPQKPYKGEEKKPQYEIGITYELVDVFMIDKDGNEVEDKPRWISETLPFYGLEADRAKSTQRYLAADPDNVYNGDFSKLVGVAVNVSIVNNQSGDKVYDNIATIATMRAKDVLKCPDLVNEPKVFDRDDPDLEIFNSFPQWIQDKIKANLEFKGSVLEKFLKDGPAKKEDKPAKDKKETPADDDSNDDKPWD